MEDREITEWNNPLKDISTDYCIKGFFTEHGGCFEVVLTSEEVMAVSALMLLGMSKVERINSGEEM